MVEKSSYREKSMRERLARLEQDWGIFKDFVERRMGRSPENVPLKELREFYAPNGPTHWLDVAHGGVAPMVTVSGSICWFLWHLHNLITDWQLEVSVNVTVPEVLVAAKGKLPELLTSR